MIYNIIGLNKKEYKDYDSKYYMYTVEYPHKIQVSKDIYISVVENKILSFNIDDYLTIVEYNGQVFYKYLGKEEK